MTYACQSFGVLCLGVRNHPLLRLSVKRDYNILMQKTERLMAITLLLQARGKMTAKRLADLLGVSTRTIYRDMDTLSLAHVPVSMDYGPGGGYYLPDNYRFESAIFTREEAISLVLGGAMAGS